jgi:quercetin dioxygenase-like cupin family protein
MNSLLTTVERPAPLLQINTLLAREGFTCTLLTFAPDSEAILPESASADPQLLYVVAGDIAVHTEGLTTIVNRGSTFLVQPGRTTVVSARAEEPSRVLRVEIPPRQFATPQFFTPRA